ncbi:MAG: glucose-1-phosphate thymidylyltransferase, partial [Acidocella sp.]|nr:glucose-1-phosphate thymidylyltransferase [Acidocella sp.]
AFRMGFIDAAALARRAALIGKTELGRILADIAAGAHP